MSCDEAGEGRHQAAQDRSHGAWWVDRLIGDESMQEIKIPSD